MFPAHRPSIERNARQCEQHYPEDQIQEGQEQQREFNQLHWVSAPLVTLPDGL